MQSIRGLLTQYSVDTKAAQRREDVPSERSTALTHFLYFKIEIIGLQTSIRVTQEKWLNEC